MKKSQGRLFPVLALFIAVVIDPRTFLHCDIDSLFKLSLASCAVRDASVDLWPSCLTSDMIAIISPATSAGIGRVVIKGGNKSRSTKRISFHFRKVAGR